MWKQQNATYWCQSNCYLFIAQWRLTIEIGFSDYSIFISSVLEINDVVYDVVGEAEGSIEWDVTSSAAVPAVSPWHLRQAWCLSVQSWWTQTCHPVTVIRQRTQRQVACSWGVTFCCNFNVDHMVNVLNTLESRSHTHMCPITKQWMRSQLLWSSGMELSTTPSSSYKWLWYFQTTLKITSVHRLILIVPSTLWTSCLAVL